MPASPRSPFAYAIVRVVPHVERGECLNAGIVLFCRPRRFLAARLRLDEARLRALAPDCDPDEVRPHLDAIERIAAGDPSGGPIARLPQAERFHWLVSPSSTVVEPSEVHSGLTADPAATLDHLLATLVEVRPAGTR
ncbi:MAG: DUF3037 domain-containing protein [Candidatus Limnocylindrales bacterium]